MCVAFDDINIGIFWSYESGCKCGNDEYCFDVLSSDCVWTSAGINHFSRIKNRKTRYIKCKEIFHNFYWSCTFFYISLHSHLISILWINCRIIHKDRWSKELRNRFDVAYTDWSGAWCFSRIVKRTDRGSSIAKKSCLDKFHKSMDN